MKKIYQTPNIKVVNIHATQMIATSLDKYETGSNGSVFTKDEGDWDDDLWDD